MPSTEAWEEVKQARKGHHPDNWDVCGTKGLSPQKCPPVLRPLCLQLAAPFHVLRKAWKVKVQRSTAFGKNGDPAGGACAHRACTCGPETLASGLTPALR